MFGLFKKRTAESKNQEIEAKRLEQVRLLEKQRADIYTIFNNYAEKSKGLNGDFCDMTNAKEKADWLDSKEAKNIGYYKARYEEYVAEKNKLIKEKHENESLLLSYIVTYPETNDAVSVHSIIPYPLIMTTPIAFNESLSNVEEVTDSLINTFFVLEEENSFMESIMALDTVSGFVGKQDEEFYYFKFLRNDIYNLAIDLSYNYSSFATINRVPFEEEDIDDYLAGIGYAQSCIILVLEELVKVVDQCLQFEAYIRDLNNTSGDDFLTFIDE